MKKTPWKIIISAFQAADKGLHWLLDLGISYSNESREFILRSDVMLHVNKIFICEKQCAR